jgi:quercetin dioxygenase-like cupin family protein
MQGTTIDTTQFEAELLRDGYLEVVDKRIPADVVIDDHTHPYDVRALVLEGEATIACAGEAPRVYRPGDVLVVAAGVTHTEHYGPEGYRFLVGRRYPAQA